MDKINYSVDIDQSKGRVYLIQVRTSVLVSSALLFALIVGIPLFKGTEVIAKTVASNVACSHFSSRNDAQAVFNSDRIKYRILDRNHDGIACNALVGK